MQPRLIVTIDTEEEGLWTGAFRAHGHTVENIRGVGRFQSLCDRYQIAPTYLIDSPVVADDFAADLFRSTQTTGRCEVGAHLHPWCAPPFEEELCPRNSYLCNLPVDLQRRKLEWLTEQISERIGRAPTSFRAGRYGLDGAGAEILGRQGYRVDSSVIPFSDFTRDGGPQFSRAPFRPFLIGRQGLLEPDERGFLLEVPVSVGFSRPDFDSARRWREWGLRPLPRRLRAVGLLDRLGMARRIKFSPEQADARQLKKLVASYLANNAECMVLMFHSSSLVPGASPYVRDAMGLERFYGTLESIFEYCLAEARMAPATLTQFAECWYARLAADRSEEAGSAVGSPLRAGGQT